MSDKSRTYIGNRYYFYRLFFSNDLVTELCLKWAFECLSVVHRINRKSPVKRWFYGTGLIWLPNVLGFSGETGFWTCQSILSVYQRYNIKVKNKCSKIVAHFWRLFETLLNAYAIILSRFKDTKKRTHCQMLYNKYFQPLHCYTF